MSDKDEGLPTRLRRYRQQHRLTQHQLAQRVGVGQTAISQIETGAKRPRLDTLEKIASALDISTAVLLSDEANP